MIEVQLLSSGTEKTEYVNACRAGLDSPLVTIHEGSGIEGDLNTARINIWDTCGGELLSFVDPEDIPNVNAWQKLQDAMDQNPKAMGAYTFESTFGGNGNILRQRRMNPKADPYTAIDFPTHLSVVRRSLYEMVRPYLQSQTSGIAIMLAIAAHRRGGLICVPEFLYKQRRHFPYRGTRNLPNTQANTEFITWLDAQPV